MRRLMRGKAAGPNRQRYGRSLAKPEISTGHPANQAGDAGSIPAWL